MPKFITARFFLIPIFILIVTIGVIGLALYYETPSHELTVAFLNIGQGDSIYVESPTHRQMLIDGGPNQRVLSEINKFIPWYDKSIDVLMVTNPDADHYAGFIDILNRYNVGEIIEPGTLSDTPTYKRFEDEIAAKHIPKIIARRGMVIDLGGGVYFKVLFPDRDVSKLATNDGSIVGQLVYASTTIMFTGDAPSKTEEYVLTLDGAAVKSDVLKEGHHGSRTSASEKFIAAVAPQYDVISAGLNNRYGHPHQETIDLLNKLHIPTLITFKLGTIVLKSDGKTFSITH